VVQWQLPHKVSGAALTRSHHELRHNTEGKNLTNETFSSALSTFFSAGGTAPVRQKVVSAIDAAAKELATVLEELDGYRFYSSSLLIVYDSDPSNDAALLRLIDFTNATMPVAVGKGDEHAARGTAQAGPDAGALLGLRTLRDQLTVAVERCNSSTAAAVVLPSSE
jgi:inositol-hexakisphosphate kinase